MAADGNAHSWGTRLPAKSPQHQAFSQEQVGALGAAGGASVKTAWGLEAPEPPPHLRRPVSTSSRLTSVSPPNPGARGRNPHAWGHLSAQGLCRHHSWRIFWFLPQPLAVPSLRRVLIPVLIKPRQDWGPQLPPCGYTHWMVTSVHSHAGSHTHSHTYVHTLLTLTLVSTLPHWLTHALSHLGSHSLSCTFTHSLTHACTHTLTHIPTSSHARSH